MKQYHGTIVAGKFDAEADSQALRTAMKGLGTDDKVLIEIIGRRTHAQLVEIENKFKSLFGRDLVEDIKSETSGNYKDAVVSRFLTHTQYAAQSLREAIKGAGTDEDVLVEILTTRTNAEIKQIKEDYTKLFKHDLEKDIINDTSGDFKRLCVSLTAGNRDESTNVNREQAKADAQALYKAGEGKTGTDEEKFNSIFCARSHAHLEVVFEEYKALSKNDILKAVDSEMSGYLKQGMLAIAKVVLDRPAYFAELLHKSMSGAGTNDKALIRLVVSRAEFDMVEIKDAFQKKYGKSLASWIEADTSGDYKKFLLQLIL
jgi:annexin A7/11